MSKEYTLEELRQDLLPIVKRVPSYVRLILALYKDDRIAKEDNAKLGAGIGYLISPIDLIPGIIPVLGQLDDLLVVLVSLKRVMAHYPSEIIEPHLRQTDLSQALLERDIEVAKRAAKRISITVAKKTGRGLLKAGRHLVEFLAKHRGRS
ncbi:MAG: YkvA family protein [Candidatus Aquicultorales bacterium]